MIIEELSLVEFTTRTTIQKVQKETIIKERGLTES